MYKITNPKSNNYFMLQMQLFIIRVYIGLDFIPHFSEKFGWMGHNGFDESY